MSTRLTKNDVPMVDSQSLKLLFGTDKLGEQITHYLVKGLQKKKYESITPSILSFLGALDCGINYGSEIARNLGVSRQMVAKTVKELCQIGYLQQVEGNGKQKQILFTRQGERLISEARQLLLELDQVLIKKLGKNNLKESLSTIEEIQRIVSRLNTVD